MFTGIVQGKATVKQIEHLDQFMRLTLELPEDRCDNLQTGASIAVNGTCLTITGFSGQLVNFDLIMETLKVTNLGELRVGSQVNFERAARFGDEIGGHLLSGHVHSQISLRSKETPADNCILWFDVPGEFLKYIMPKGFVALNGCSLTVGDVTDQGFNIYLIPETLQITTFGDLQPGAKINLEIDSQTQAVVDTIERYMQHNHSA